MSFDLTEELHGLIRVFDANHLPYAVCGAAALAIHGHPRATKDLDLLVAAEDAERAKLLARSRGFDLAAAPMVFSSGIEVHRVSKVEGSEFLTVELLVASKGLAEVFTNRQQITTEWGPVWVVSRAGLIAMKVAASRPQDLADVARLREEP